MFWNQFWQMNKVWMALFLVLSVFISVQNDCFKKTNALEAVKLRNSHFIWCASSWSGHKTTSHGAKLIMHLKKKEKVITEDKLKKIAAIVQIHTNGWNHNFLMGTSCHFKKDTVFTRGVLLPAILSKQPALIILIVKLSSLSLFHFILKNAQNLEIVSPSPHFNLIQGI